MALYNLLPLARNQYFDDNGVPLAAGKLHTYQAGTNTDKATYQDAEGLTPHQNPIPLDAAGRATVYLGEGAYKIVVKDADNVTVWTEDNIVTSSATYVANNMAALKALAPGSVSMVTTKMYDITVDFGGWTYLWYALDTAVDDGGMIIQPVSLPVRGRWRGIIPIGGMLSPAVYGAKLDGATDDVAAIQKCDTYCYAHSLAVNFDNNAVFNTDPELKSRVKLGRNVQLIWGSFSPTIIFEPDLSDLSYHFPCDIAHIPTLVTPFIRPEWFNETWDSHPKTTACFDRSRITTRKMLFTGIIATTNAEMN